MKQWLKKMIQNLDQSQNDNKQIKSFNDKNKKIIVSFDKHIEKNIIKISSQKNKNNINYVDQQYQEDYCPRRYSNFSNCVEIDESQENYSLYSSNNKNGKKGKQKPIDVRKKIKQNIKIVQAQPYQIQSGRNKQNQDEKVDYQSQSDQINSSQEERNQIDPQVQISQQIVNSLISMENLMKMIQNIPQTKGQYIALKHINKLLTKFDRVNKTQLCNFMLSKNSQGFNAYFKKDGDKGKQKAYTRIVKRLIKHRIDEDFQQTKKQQALLKFFYRTFSNGLIFQYYPVRALIWKITSGYLPESKEKWIWKMEVSLLKYRQLVKEYICEPVLRKKKNYQNKQNNPQQGSGRDLLNLKQENIEQLQIRKKSQTFSDPLSRMSAVKKIEKDHPLNSKQDSKWKTYFEDYELWSLIEKDTLRTRQSCSFFKEANVFSLTNQESKYSDTVSIELQNNEKVEFRLNELHLSKIKKDCTTYADALTRIIFIYLKINPQQKYYQGINQLVAVLYYSLTNKNNEYFRRVSESDTYELLTLLMTQLNTYPLHIQDNKKLPPFNHFISGQKYFHFLKTMIHKYDFRLYDFLNNNKGFQYLQAIAVRWFLTIFLTEFGLDEALILWDCVIILIDPKSCSINQKRHALKDLKLNQFMLYMALAVVHLNRNEIFPQDSEQVKDSSNILIVFQKIKQNPEEIIEKAINLYKSFPNLLQ